MKVSFLVFRYWIFSEMSRLQRFARLLNKLILKELKDIESELKNKSSNKNEFLEDLYNYYPKQENESDFIKNELMKGIKYQYNYEIKENLQQVLWSSLFITTYSFFETSLSYMCKYYAENANCSIKLNDIYGKGFLRSRTYFKKVMNINFPDDKPSWSHIVKYNRIRNILAHNDGYIEKPEDVRMLEAYVKNEKTLTINNNFITLSFDFIVTAISIYSDFFVELMDVLPIEFKLKKCQ